MQARAISPSFRPASAAAHLSAGLGAAVLCVAANAAAPSAQSQDSSERYAQAQKAQQGEQQSSTEKQQRQATRQGTAGSSPGTGAAVVAPVAVMIVPLSVAVADNSSNGCWARFYSDQNFKGDVLTLSGAMSIQNMDRAQPYWGEADSAIIGPKARVTTYDNKSFNDQTAVLQSGQRIDNLRDKLRWNEGIESVRMECTS